MTQNVSTTQNEVLLPHEKEIRARHLPYSPYIRTDVRLIRRELGIPEGGFSHVGDAIKWRVSHCEDHGAGRYYCISCGLHLVGIVSHCETKTRRLAYESDLEAPRPPEGWNWLRHQEFWSYKPEHVQVPLYRCVSDLVARYEYTGWAFFVLVWYTLTDRFWIPRIDDLSFPYPSPNRPRSHRYLRVDYPSKSQAAVTFTFDEYTTNEEIEKEWPQDALKLRRELRNNTGIFPASRRAGASEKWERQFQRDVYWHELSQELVSAEKVADYLTDHCQEGDEDVPSVSTIRSAIQKTEKQMKPRI